MDETVSNYFEYVLELCETADEAEGSLARWSEKAAVLPGAEVQLIRLPLPDAGTLFCIAPNKCELPPPALQKFHAELAAGVDPESAAWRLLKRTGYGYSWPHAPGPIVKLDLTHAGGWSRGVLTEWEWEAIQQQIG